MAKTITTNQYKSILEIVQGVILNGYATDKSLYYSFRNNKITNEFDRGVIAEVSYEIIRWYRLLLEIHNNYPPSNEVNFNLLINTWAVLNKLEINPQQASRNINKTLIIVQFEQLRRVRKIAQSIPDWLDIKGFDAYGADWENELIAFNKAPTVFLRTNRLKIKPAELSQLLNNEGFKNTIITNASDAIKLEERTNVFSSKYFEQGYFEVQDAGSQLISHYLDARSGMRVCDACAGNGGKSLHLASIMQNKGKIISLDNQPIKLQTLKKRAAKASIDIIETKVIESSKTIKRMENSFDRLLLDVPCSGTGALRRNPELKWKNTPEKIEKLKTIQEEILQKYPIMLRAGGVLVYATCSILPEENQEQVQKFLQKNSNNYELIKEQTILPASTGFDGFYMAQLRKK